MKRENEALEKYKSLHNNRVRLALEEIKKIDESVEAKNKFINNYNILRDMRVRKEAEHSKLMEAARNDALATVIKAIYITAMEAEAMTDQGILLAEQMVDSWIEERGGASKILDTNTANKTYLLSRITQLVEEVAQDTVDEIEKDETVEDDEEKSKDIKIAELQAREAEIKAQIANLKAEKKADDEEDKKAEEEAPEEPAAEEEEKSEEDSEAVPDNDDKADGVEATEDGQVDGDGKEDTDPSTEEASEEEPKEEEDSPEDTEEPAAEEEKKSEEEPKEEEDAPEAATDEGETEEVPDVDASDDNESEEPAAEEESEETSEEDTPESEESTEEAPSEESEDSDDGVETDVEVEVDPEEDEEMKDDIEELTDDEVDGDESGSEDDDISDAIGEPLDDDGVDSDTSVDGEPESNGKIFDDLDKEEDVRKAIDLIRTRVADAEETFIRNNAEDKKKIDELLDKIANNVKTVENLDKKDPAKAQVAKEAAIENKRKINSIKKDRVNTIFEKMATIFTENIVKNENARDIYLNESGSLDVDLVVESAKVMYGFLETLNTLQLEKVDEKYIKKVLDDMKE